MYDYRKSEYANFAEEYKLDEKTREDFEKRVQIWESKMILHRNLGLLLYYFGNLLILMPLSFLVPDQFVCTGWYLVFLLSILYVYWYFVG